jgi:hypothetical protein
MARTSQKLRCMAARHSHLVSCSEGVSSSYRQEATETSLRSLILPMTRRTASALRLHARSELHSMPCAAHKIVRGGYGLFYHSCPFPRRFPGPDHTCGSSGHSGNSAPQVVPLSHRPGARRHLAHVHGDGSEQCWWVATVESPKSFLSNNAAPAGNQVHA